MTFCNWVRSPNGEDRWTDAWTHRQDT